MEEAFEYAVVMTSANTLYDFLSEVAKQSNSSLINAVNAVLGDKSSNDAMSFTITKNLFERLSADLDNALTDKERLHAQKYLSSFMSLKKLESYATHINSLKKSPSILSTQKLDDLQTLHLILSGKIESKPIEITKEYKSSLDELISSLENIGLPEELDQAIKKRIFQVRNSIENYQYLGPESVSNALEQLVGAIEIYTTKQVKESGKGKSFLTSLTKTVMCISAMIIGTEKSVDSSLKLLGHVDIIQGYLEDGTQENVDKGEEE